MTDQIARWPAEFLRMATDVPYWQAAVLLVLGNLFMAIRWLVKPQYYLARESGLKAAGLLFVAFVLAYASQLHGALRIILLVLAAIVLALMGAHFAIASSAYAKRAHHPLVSTVVALTGLHLTIVASVVLIAIWTQSAWWHRAARNVTAGEAVVLAIFALVLVVFGPSKVRYERAETRGLKALVAEQAGVHRAVDG